MFSQTSHKYAQLQSNVFNGLEKNGKIFLENNRSSRFCNLIAFQTKKPQACAHSESLFFCVAYRGTNLMFLRNNVPPSNSIREHFVVYMVKLT